MDINRSNYRTESEYNAALRDKEKIDKIRLAYDFTNKASVDKLYKEMINGSISFETEIGNSFDDEVYELRRKLSSQTNITEKKNAKVNAKATIGTKTDIKNKEKSPRNNKKKTEKVVSDEPLDGYMKKQVLEELRRQEKRRRLLIIFSSVMAACLLGYFGYYYYSQDKSEKRFQSVANLVGSDALAGEPTSVTATIVTTDNGLELTVLDKYQSVYNSNKKLIGWLKIDDTNIDYPVMQCSDNEFYLTHNFDSEEDKAGALFLDANCDAARGNDNFIIYGHHLTSGRMFSSLPNYESENYYKKHMYIRFDTIYEEHVYQVMYAFRSRVYNEDDVVFKYYQFIDANSEEEFYSYMNEMKNLAFYDTGVTASYGDQLLTLSTCDYHEENGRFVVVAKRIS